MKKLRKLIALVLSSCLLCPLFPAVAQNTVRAAASEPERLTLNFEDQTVGSWEGISSDRLTIITEEDGNNVLKIMPNAHDQFIVNTGLDKVASGRLSFRIKTEVANRFGFVIRYQSASSNAAFIQTPTKDRWNFFDGSHSTFINQPYLKQNQWNQVEVSFQGSHYTFVVNGETYLDQEIAGYPENAGYMGFKFLDGELDGQVYYIDDFIMEKSVDSDAPPSFQISPDPVPGDTDLKLWYDEPAEVTPGGWETEGLPIGNGSMGGMFYGRVDQETLQINEKTLWDGGPNAPGYGAGYDKADAWQNIEPFIEEFYRENPNQNTLTALTNSMTGNEGAFGCYLNYGSIQMDYRPFLHGEIQVENYRKELSLREGLGRVRYSIDGVQYTREYLASYPDEVMAIHLTASQPGKLNLVLRSVVDDSPSHISGSQKSRTYTTSAEGNTISVEGVITGSQMKFASQYRVISSDAEVTANSDGTLTIQNGQEATILIGIKTDYENQNHLFTDPANPPDYHSGKNPLDEVKKVLNTAEKKSYQQLLQSHQSDYKEYFDRVDLQLGTGAPSTLSTKELLKASSRNLERDPYMDELLYQYGRYLLIASSREGSLPANLQGVWNIKNKPDWNSDYHFNVNIQMIYWPAYVANLSDMALPYIDLIDSLKTPGKTTAKAYFNVEDGYVFHMKTNAFGYTAPGTKFTWGWSPGSSSWTLQNVWEYYEFTNDKEMLENTIYPLLKGNCEFWLAALRTDPVTGDLVAVPSFSPENGPRSVGTTFDQELVWQLFTDTIEAASILGKDGEFAATLMEKREKLNPLAIGEDGQIKEWREETKYGVLGEGTSHRHISQLVGLYPGKHITTETPEWMEAAKRTLELRGDGGTGWSMAHKINLWARTGDAAHTYKLLTNLINYFPDWKGISGGYNGGFYANLFDVHPPFQLDGNFGLTSGISEMLLQSQAGAITPLPTLPKQWKDGSFKGLVARNNFVVDAQWSDSRLQSLSVTSRSGNDCVISYITEVGRKITFPTKVNETYTIDDNPGPNPPITDVDTTALQESIRKAAPMNAQLHLYLDGEAKDRFIAAYQQAALALEQGGTQEQVDAAALALHNAMLSLRLKPSAEALKELLQKADEVELSLYTEESTARFLAAREHADAMLADPQVTERQLTAAFNRLDTAIQQLAKKGTNDAVDKPAGSSTGDQPPYLLFALPPAAVFLFLLAKKKRYRRMT